MLWLTWKEIITESRYKMMMFNLWVNPFFMIAPYVLLAESYGISAHILESMILWSWLVQFMFGISNSINDLKMEGTFTNILMMPCKFVTYQFMFYLYMVCDNLMMTFVTLLLSKWILGVTVNNLFYFICLLLISSLTLFCFSVGYTYIVLRFKKISGINNLMQQLFGYLSGYTTSITKYPIILRFVSYCLPLTYAIMASYNGYSLTYNQLLIWLGLSLLYLIIGSVLVEKGINKMKMRGDIEQW